MIELSVVIAIIGLLYATVVPLYHSTILRSKETALKENLHVMRKMIDAYYKDRQVYPTALADLVQNGYIRAVPVDPLTDSAETWRVVPSTPLGRDIYDVHSGSDKVSSEGTAYGTW